MRQIMSCKPVPTLFLLVLGICALLPIEMARVNAEAGSPSQQSASGTMKKQNEKESPFTCNVSGLSTDQRQRWEALLTQLNDAKQEVGELPNGYAFRFSATSSMVKDVAEFITYERSCCPFFDFELAVEREGGPLWLRLKGRPGVKAFIKSGFGL
jgi:hypothetical protein